MNKKKVLLFGGSGLVGSKFIELYSQDFDIKSPPASEVDILNKDYLLEAVKSFNPEAVINFAAYTDVQKAEEEKDHEEGIVFRINATGAKNVSEVCKEENKYLIHISTEYVFDGTKEESPYTEEDKPNPINWYGQTKLFGEQFVLEIGGNCLVVRISMPYSARYEKKNDVARFFLQQLKLKNQIKAIEDQRITPTLVNDIARALSNFLEKRPGGIYHVSSTDSVSPLELVKTIAETFQLDYSLTGSTTLDEYNEIKKAKLLKYSWLNPTKFEREFGDQILHTVEEGLIIFKQELTQG